MEKVKMILNDGTKMQGYIDTDDVSSLLNDKTTFVELIRPDGYKLLLAKGYIAYIFPEDWKNVTVENIV